MDEGAVRLLEARPSRSGEICRDALAVRARRMAENGEALRYIELMLRQLQRASRDHRRLVRQRHADSRHEMSMESISRLEEINERTLRHRDDPMDAARIWSRSSSSPWESDASARTARQPNEYPRPDATTRLLTKRKDYGGTAHSSTADIFKPTSKRIRDEVAGTAYRSFGYVVPEDVGWRSARGKGFGAWNLPETQSSNDRRTSSTVV